MARGISVLAREQYEPGKEKLKRIKTNLFIRFTRDASPRGSSEMMPFESVTLLLSFLVFLCCDFSDLK